MTPDSAPYRLGVLCVTVSAVAWSTAGFFTRLIPLDAWTILFWRGIFAGFSIADVSIIYATVPFVTAALAWIWLREHATAATWAASGLAFAGVAVTLSGATFGANLWGKRLAFAMTAAVAVMMVISRRHRDIPMVPAAARSTLLGALISLPWATPAAAGPTDLAYLALSGCCQMTLGLTLIAIGARLIPAAHTAIGALETALAPLWVWIAFSERPPPLVLLGGAIVMLAVIGHVLIENRRGTAESARIGAAAPGAECP